MTRGTIVFGSSVSTALAKKIAKEAGARVGKARIARFNDNEIDIEILEELKDQKVFVVGSLQPPADNLMEVVLLCKAARSLAPKKLTLILPYLGYNRQDKASRGKPHAARAYIEMLKGTADKVITLELHAADTARYFGTISRKEVTSTKLVATYVKKHLRDVVIASPDAGGKTRADASARLIGQTRSIVFHKTRRKPGEAKVSAMHTSVNIIGKDVLLVDDMIDTGGTLIAAAHAAKEAGAKNIYAFATHGLFSKDAVARFEKSPIREVVITDTVAHSKNKFKTKRLKITVLSIAPLLAKEL